MKIKADILIFLSLLLLTGCFSTTVSRFKSTKFKGENNSLVAIKLFNTRIEPPQSGIKNMLLLSDHGQAEYLKILKERYNNDEEKFNSALKGECFRDDGELKTDYINRDLKIVFSISKKKHDYDSIGKRNIIFSPADRIEYLKFSLRLDPTSNLKFTKWNRYVTDYDTLNVADITFNRSMETSASVGAGEGSSVKAEITPKISQSIEEKHNVSYRYILLNGSISDTLIEIEEEGTRSIDLAGNVVADVSVRFPETPLRVASMKNLTCSAGNYNYPEKTEMRFDIVNIPSLDDALIDTIKGYLCYEYYFRHVIKGYKTFYEWDDNVVYYKGKVSDTLNLFYKTDYMPKFYYINFTNKNSGTDSSKIYVKDKLTGEEYFLVFKNYVEARDFSKWLLNFPIGKPYPIAKPSPLTDSPVLSDSIRINPGFTLMKRSFGCQHSEALTKKAILGMNISIMDLSHLKKLDKF